MLQSLATTLKKPRSLVREGRRVTLGDRSHCRRRSVRSSGGNANGLPGDPAALADEATRLGQGRGQALQHDRGPGDADGFARFDEPERLVFGARYRATGWTDYVIVDVLGPTSPEGFPEHGNSFTSISRPRLG